MGAKSASSSRITPDRLVWAYRNDTAAKNSSIDGSTRGSYPSYGSSLYPSRVGRYFSSTKLWYTAIVFFRASKKISSSVRAVPAGSSSFAAPISPATWLWYRMNTTYNAKTPGDVFMPRTYRFSRGTRPSSSLRRSIPPHPPPHPFCFGVRDAVHVAQVQKGRHPVDRGPTQSSPLPAVSFPSRRRPAP